MAFDAVSSRRPWGYPHYAPTNVLRSPLNRKRPPYAAQRHPPRRSRPHAPRPRRHARGNPRRQDHRPRNPPPSRPSRVFSTETIVDVTVTDAKGNPVHNLKESDFTIKEDSKPQPIRSFAEFNVGEQPDHPGSPRSPPASTPTTRPRPPPAPSTSSSSTRCTPTSSPPCARCRPPPLTSATCPKAPRSPSSGSPPAACTCCRVSPPTRTSCSPPPTPPAPTSAPAATATTSAYVTVQALQQLGEYVAAIKGRKNLIWFTPGMPVYLLRDGGYGWGATSPACRENEPRLRKHAPVHRPLRRNPQPIQQPQQRRPFHRQYPVRFAHPPYFMGN